MTGSSKPDMLGSPRRGCKNNNRVNHRAATGEAEVNLKQHCSTAAGEAEVNLKQHCTVGVTKPGLRKARTAGNSST
jgi:hypothetical protein